jgi:hypothetical protein
MKKLLATFALFGFVCAAPFAVAEDKKDTKTLTGALIDEACGKKNDTEEKAVKHGKACTVRCADKESGKLLFISEGKTYKIEKDSKAKVLEYLKKDETKDVKAVIEGTLKDDVLTVTSIKAPEKDKKG